MSNQIPHTPNGDIDLLIRAVAHFTDGNGSDAARVLLAILRVPNGLEVLNDRNPARAQLNRRLREFG